jgi:hypothetical protein
MGDGECGECGEMREKYSNYLFPIPYSLFPIPHSLFPIPHSLLTVHCHLVKFVMFLEALSNGIDLRTDRN